MKKLVILLAATTAMAACATNDDMDATAPMAPVAPAVDPTSPLAAPMYMQMAASGDQFEIQSSQMALQMSQNPAVRSFANLLVAHHQAMSQNMMSAAQSAGLTPPPPALMPQHQQMLAQLHAAGPNFDMAFRDAQVMAHQQALELHQNYANGGDVPALRSVASAAVPIIQQHLSAAQGLNVSMAPPPMPTEGTQRAGERG